MLSRMNGTVGGLNKCHPLLPLVVGYRRYNLVGREHTAWVWNPAYFWELSTNGQWIKLSVLLFLFLLEVMHCYRPQIAQEYVSEHTKATYNGFWPIVTAKIIWILSINSIAKLIISIWKTYAWSYFLVKSTFLDKIILWIVYRFVSCWNRFHLYLQNSQRFYIIILYY